MKTRICTLFVLAGVGVLSARSEGAGSGTYEAYWLTNKAHGEYVKLILTRRPLSALPTFIAPTNQPVSDCDAIIVTTYARDSIWNVDQKPFKPLAGVEKVGSNSIVIGGETFTREQANLENVLRLLRNPEGTIPIHRMHGPVSGQEEAVRMLADRLDRQLAEERTAKGRGAPAKGDQPMRPETNRTSPAAGVLR